MLVAERAPGGEPWWDRLWPLEMILRGGLTARHRGNFPLRGKKRGRVLTGSRWSRSVAQDRSSDAAGIGLSSGSPKCWRSEEATLGE